jgi:general secretion pathway protein J
MMWRARGFTLLEILIAMATFAIFAVLAYGALGRLLDTRDRIDQEREFWRTLAMTFAQMEDDLSVARAREVRDPLGSPTPLPALRGVSVDSRGQGDAFLAVTRGGRLVVGDSPYSDLVRVGYRLEDKTLSRLTWNELDQAPQSKPVATPLLEGVTQLAVRYYSTATKGWASTWPPEGQLRQLPSAMEITLTIEGRGQFLRLLRVNG